MELETFYYNTKTGWSLEEFPSLDSNQTLVIVFGEPDLIHAPDPINELVKAYPNSHVIGCSTAGEILGRSLLEKSLVAAVVKFDHTQIKSASAPIESVKDSFLAGQQIGRSLSAPDLRAVFVLSKGLDINGTELVQGLNSELPKSVVITGGLAGDGIRFQNTWVLIDGEMNNKFVSAIGLYGDRIHVGYSYGGGWTELGLEYQVTKSQKNILFELDQKPALQIYKEYLGEEASGLPGTGFHFPIGLRCDDAPDEIIVRTVQAVSEENQSITFFGDIPNNCFAKVLWGEINQLVEGAESAANDIRDSYLGNDPLLSIAISCVGRKKVMGQRTEEEVEAVIDTYRKEIPQVGFYSYGELSPHSQGSCALHNQTMTLTTFGEK